MRKSFILSAVFSLALVALAFALNPSPEQHRERIREAVAERRPIAGLLGVGALTALTSRYHQLGVASYTTGANDRVFSLGAFGMVHVLETSDPR
ncbi:MAG: hypothetical protein U1A22_04975 [Xanthomonadaceae bacterium]|nr:hypothetical protein [Xanthomonadaceae bacterium]